MIIYIDENMSPYLAKGFDVLQYPLNIKLREPIEVKSITDAFGQGAKDEEWIPLAGKQNACIITQDYNINRIKHQRELCDRFGLGMIYFRPPSKSGFGYWDMVKLIAQLWPDITKTALTQKRPFTYRTTAKGRLESM